MKKAVLNGTKTCLAGFVFVLIFSFTGLAQKTKPAPNANLPKVALIDEISIKTALKPNGKPLLVNFWATWCDPCREEFPDLVKIDAEYKGKIDFITISLDDPADINTIVPKFLGEQKAEMPAFLLKTADESAVISSIAKDWSGGLPFTILYNEKGEIAFFRQGKVKVEMMKTELDKLLVKSQASVADKYGFLIESREDYEKGKADAQKDISNGILIVRTSGRGGSDIQTRLLREKYGIQTTNSGCFITSGIASYNKAYNEISKAEIQKRFGEDFFEKVAVEAQSLFPVANVDEVILTVNRKP